MRNKKAKNIRRQAREIAAKLPTVINEHACGGSWGVNENGAKTYKPNFYTTENNHVRRIKRAYMRNGLEGLHNYLESIHKLQTKRNETISETPSDSTND